MARAAAEPRPPGCPSVASHDEDCGSGHTPQDLTPGPDIQRTSEAGTFSLGPGSERKDTVQIVKPHSKTRQRLTSPTLHAWHRAAAQEPNWLSAMPLPLLENKTKSRACVPLPNVTQAGGKGSREEHGTGLASRDAVGGGGGTRPVNLPVPDGHPNPGRNALPQREARITLLTRLCPVSIRTDSPPPWQMQGLL